MGIFLSIFLFFIQSLFACTAFQLRSQDGAVIYARSMEFGYAMDSELLVMPHEIDFAGTVPGGQGLLWKVKYGYVGLNQSFDRMLVSDGMNEKGLVIGCLYLPCFAKYETYNPKRQEVSLGAWELPSFLLATCSSISDVKAALKKISVVEQPMPEMGEFVLPVHFYISDKSGDVLIVEYVDGIQHLYKNPIGILTNAPPFDWQLINLGNYINLMPENIDELKISNWTVNPCGQGSGLLGLPGDFTPVSRFVRAALFSNWATVEKTAIDTVRMAFHILNSFDIFDGIVRMKKIDPKVTPPGASERETTQWVVVHDQTNLKSYVRTYESLCIQGISFDRLKLDDKSPKRISLNREFQVDEL